MLADGTSEKDANGNVVYVTYRAVIANALNNFSRDEAPTAEQKNKAWQIMKKLYEGSEVNLTVDDMAFINERVAKTYPPLIYGRVSELFESKDSE